MSRQWTQGECFNIPLSSLSSTYGVTVRRDSEDVGMVSSQLFSNLISAEKQTMEHLSTRNTFTEILPEEAVDRLTSIDWSIHPVTLRMEDFSSKDRSELGGAEYVAGFIAKELLEKYPLLSRIRSQEEPENFWVAFLSEGMNGGGLVEPSKLWQATFMKWNEVFCAIRPNEETRFFPGVVGHLQSVGSNYKDAPSDVVKFFCKLRVLLV
jgi:hypothetical protein